MLSCALAGTLDLYLVAEAETALESVYASLGEEEFARAWAEGQAMTLEGAVEYALEDDGEV